MLKPLLGGSLVSLGPAQTLIGQFTFWSLRTSLCPASGFALEKRGATAEIQHSFTSIICFLARVSLASYFLLVKVWSLDQLCEHHLEAC